MPKVTIIVPVYKVEPYLRKCIDSIFDQSFSDFELILVDDGSPDNCPAICDEYAAKDSRVVVIHQENGGLPAARNAGLKVATGTYVTFCDSDDFYSPDWVSMLVAAMESSGADMIIGNYIRVEETGTVIEKTSHEPGIYSVQDIHQKMQYYYTMLFSEKHGWEVWSRIFRAEIIRKNQICFCESCGSFAEDLGFTLEYLLYAGNVISIDDSGYHYRLRNDSIMRTNNTIAKLDSMNEISLHFVNAFRNAFPGQNLSRILPIMHFLVMYNQYSKIIRTAQYSQLGEYIDGIRRKCEWKAMTKGVFRCFKDLRSHFGKANAQKILLLSHYCLHRNWNRFRYESAIAYRWFIKEE